MRNITNKTNAITSFLFLVVLFMASFLYSSIFSQKEPASQTQENTSGQQLKSKSYSTTKRETLNVLFIGNSYTNFNEMPITFSKLAEHDPNSVFRVEAYTFTKSDVSLEHFLTSQKTKKILLKKKWDYVVLQPQNLWAVKEENTRNTEKAVKLWVRMINNIGAMPVFFMTWPRKPGSQWYTTKETGTLIKNPQYMHKRIQYYSTVLAKKYNMLLVPVGDYWVQTLNDNPGLELYNPDGSHPSQIGSFLAALVFYKMLVDPSLYDITYYPDYLDEKERIALLNTVSSPPPHGTK